jgi:hypothetical protein
VVRHLEEMHAAEHLDEAGAVERPFLNRKKRFSAMEAELAVLKALCDELRK